MYLHCFERTLSSGKIISFLILNFTVFAQIFKGQLKLLDQLTRTKRNK